MDEKLRIESFFVIEDEATLLTKEGLDGINIFLKKYSGDQIRKISDITRSALINYKKKNNAKISKRGQRGIQKLINFYNEADPEVLEELDAASAGLGQYSERELMLELKRRGLKVTITI